MNVHHLLFNECCEYLGEVRTSGGKFVTALLPEDSILEGHLDAWRTEGVRITIERIEKGKYPLVFLHESCMLDAPKFAQYLRKWCDERNMHCLDLSPEKMDAWNMLLKLTLEEKERFYFTALLHSSSHPQFERIREDLEHVLDSVKTHNR